MAVSQKSVINISDGSQRGNENVKMNICDHTRKERIRNDIIRENIGVAPIEEKTIENRLRWFGYVQRRLQEVSVRRVYYMDFSTGKRRRGRLERMLKEIIKGRSKKES